MGRIHELIDNPIKWFHTFTVNASIDQHLKALSKKRWCQNKYDEGVTCQYSSPLSQSVWWARLWWKCHTIFSYWKSLPAKDHDIKEPSGYTNNVQVSKTARWRMRSSHRRLGKMSWTEVHSSADETFHWYWCTFLLTFCFYQSIRMSPLSLQMTLFSPFNNFRCCKTRISQSEGELRGTLCVLNIPLIPLVVDELVKLPLGLYPGLFFNNGEHVATVQTRWCMVWFFYSSFVCLSSVSIIWPNYPHPPRLCQSTAAAS